ncbi:MAG: FlgD immunoglobulin-like domain containing protein, partial [Bacteroidota bacterium]
GEIANEDRYGLALQGLGVTSVLVEAGDPALSSAAIGLTKKQSLIWYANHDGSGIAGAVLDTLEAACLSGNHLVMSGKNMLKYNDDHTLFSDHLGVAFQDDFIIPILTSAVTGFASSPIGTGLELRILKVNQDTADIISPLKPAVRKAFYYGNTDPDTLNLAGLHLDETGSGGKALVLGMDLHTQQTSLIAEVLRRSFNYFAGITGVEPVTGLPGARELFQNYPNPFNPGTAITFSITAPAPVSLKIYNSLGQEVRTLIAGEQQDAGLHTILWDGTNDAGRPVATGVYVYRMASGRFVETKRMILLR